MTDFDRRTVLKTGGAALTIGLAGCLADGRGVPGRTDPPDDDNGEADFQAQIDDHLSDTGNYDGTIADFTGEDEIEITNGVVEGTEQSWVYDPPAINIDPGTTVTWVWSGDDAHSVTHSNGDDFDSGTETGDGFTFEHTFDEDGLYLYHCIPHETLGQKGAVIVGDILDDEPGGELTMAEYLEDVDNYDGTAEDLTGQDQVDVQNGEVDGDWEQTWMFEPPVIEIDAGTTVTWTWVGDDAHSVTHTNGDAFDSGTDSGDGMTFEHTFEDPGTYLYHCIPHEALGQKGAVIVE